MKPFVINTHYLAGSSPHNLLRILFKNNFNISFRYIPRVFQIFFATVLFYPFFILEKILFTNSINKTLLSHPPIFIIGHWRSGTTYMHNLVSQDSQFAYPTTYQCFMPGIFLTGKGFIKRVLTVLLPEKRPMDNVKLGADYPQEDEFAINALCPYSFYEALCFPKKTKIYFNEYALLETGKHELWKKYYNYFFKKIAYINNNKQIISKNPVNTVRIRELLALYPGAKFIYLNRDREQVLNSTFNLYNKFLNLYSFQNFNATELEENLLWLYNKTIEAYQSQKTFIAPKNLVEIEYQNLIEYPLAEIKGIYSKLELNGFENTKNRFIEYIASQKSYKPNTELFWKMKG